MALLYQEQEEDGTPTLNARIGAMHLADCLDNIRALKLAYVKTK